MSTDQYSKGTCEQFHLGDCSDDAVKQRLFLNPCDCTNYLQCGLQYNMEPHQCSAGTAWNHIDNICDTELDVLFNLCDVESPWTRCNVSESRLNQLEAYCTNTTWTSPSVTESTTTSPSVSESTTTSPSVSESTTSDTAAATSGDSGVDAGIIVGAVIAGAVLTLIIVTAFIILRRRRRLAEKKSGLKRDATVMENPQYFEGGHADDPYAVIDDSLNDPTYRQDSYMEPNSSKGSSANGTLQGNTLADTVTGVDTVYDNTPAGDREATPGYTTYRQEHSPSDEAPDTPYRTLEAGNKPIPDAGPAYRTSEAGTSNTDDDDDPSYRTLDAETTSAGIHDMGASTNWELGASTKQDGVTIDSEVQVSANIYTD